MKINTESSDSELLAIRDDLWLVGKVLPDCLGGVVRLEGRCDAEPRKSLSGGCCFLFASCQQHLPRRPARDCCGGCRWSAAGARGLHWGHLGDLGHHDPHFGHFGLRRASRPAAPIFSARLLTSRRSGRFDQTRGLADESLVTNIA